jgi:hypothetical protein
MISFYIMRYVGRSDSGAGAVCVGNGRTLGVDSTAGKIEGAYTEQNGRLSTSHPDGATRRRVASHWPADAARRSNPH